MPSAVRSGKGPPATARRSTLFYLLPEAQRQGLGRALLRALARGLAARGHASILVWVLSDNPACHFYEAMGGTLISESTISVGQQTLASRAYGWRPIQTILGVAA